MGFHGQCLLKDQHTVGTLSPLDPEFLERVGFVLIDFCPLPSSEIFLL